ncbi:hypothetical protein N7280_06815 [Rickettsia rhipicephali]|uniref:hypothetical protein n=1 Tax=Rickettsia rhipicephali TaxID=33992 RepID=UPI00224D202D|nr:hypothetical protein [Rickettsia rhipicephali]MCX4080278.1 hypothetical protein [Rickettsia rhipicephali]
MKENAIKRIPRGVSIEITVLWGIAFSVLLDMYSSNPSYHTIKYSMSIVTLVFLSGDSVIKN